MTGLCTRFARHASDLSAHLWRRSGGGGETVTRCNTPRRAAARFKLALVKLYARARSRGGGGGSAGVARAAVNYADFIAVDLISPMRIYERGIYEASARHRPRALPARQRSDRAVIALLRAARFRASGYFRCRSSKNYIYIYISVAGTGFRSEAA